MHIGGSKRVLQSACVGEKVYRFHCRLLFSSSIAVVTDISYPDFSGALLMPRWSEKGKHNYVVYSDIYALHRALAHGQDTYEQSTQGEIPRMAKALTAATILQGIQLGVNTQNAGAYQDELLTAAATAIDAIGPNARLVGKREALDQLAAIAKGRDSRGRVNPTVLLTRLAAVIRRVDAREQDATNIDGVFAFRRQIVRTTIQLLETQVAVARSFLAQVLANWPQIASHKRHLIAGHVDAMAEVFRTIDIQPFRTNFAFAAIEYNFAASALRNGNPDTAKVFLQRSAAGFALRSLRAELERAYFSISRVVRLRQPLDTSATLLVLSDCTQELENLYTDNLRQFDKPVVSAGIKHAAQHLRDAKLHDAYTTLQQVVRLV